MSTEKDKKTSGRKKKIITDIFAETTQAESTQSREPEKKTPFHFHSITMAMDKKEARQRLGMDILGRIKSPRARAFKAQELLLTFDHENKLFRIDVLYPVNNEFEETALTEAIIKSYGKKAGATIDLRFSRDRKVFGPTRLCVTFEDRARYKIYIEWIKETKYKDI